VDDDRITSVGLGRRRVARPQVDVLVEAAFVELLAVRAGDLGAIHQAYVDMTRAVRLTLEHALDLDAA
jgi:hypothetical protein